LLDKILKELHQKITPFILRREKIDVLKELPQKIIQDYYCSMTELQVFFLMKIILNGKLFLEFSLLRVRKKSNISLQ